MRARSAAISATVLVAALLALGAVALRSCSGAGPAEQRAATPATTAPAAGSEVAAGAVRWEVPVPSPAAGWQDAAETVAIDLHRFLLGRPAAGAFEEARAEAARGDLALFPPDPSELRRMLLSPDARARMLALAALAARAEATDDLVRIVLRSQRPDDDEVLRLLAAEVVAALPAERLARHEDDLLRAFQREPNPLVVAVALPALERMEDARLRALLESQLALAGPEMVPVLAALARDRLGAEGVRSVGVAVFEAPGE